MASTYHRFDRYRSTTNSYIEKQTAYGMIWLRHIIVFIGIDRQQIRILRIKQAYGMIWLRHIIGLIHIDKIIGEVLL